VTGALRLGEHGGASPRAFAEVKRDSEARVGGQPMARPIVARVIAVPHPEPALRMACVLPWRCC
jgi:hypothetical protein